MTRQQKAVLQAARDWYATVARVGAAVSVDGKAFIADNQESVRKERAALRRLWDATEDLVGMRKETTER